MLCGDILDELSPPLQRPFVRSPEKCPVALRERVAEGNHALDDPRRVSHYGVRALPRWSV